MRALLASTAVALLLGLSPASAMCGGGGQQQSMSVGQGGMCGAPAAAKQLSEWPTREQEGQKQASMGMCACCKDMAMMGGMKGEDPHKGMEMPKPE
jgi:hypothetical protein